VFEFLVDEPWYKRWARGAFIVLTPVAFLLFLLRGREAVIYVSMEPFWLSNYAPSTLPTFFAELLSYGYYLGTAAALVLAFVAALTLRRRRPVPRRSGNSLVWYLPAFVAGVEAMRHAQLLGQRHGFTDLPTQDQLQTTWLIAAAASVALVVVCVVLGVVFAKLARDSSRVPFATVPVVLSVVCGWYALLSLLWPVA
jgi:hypothetical protein